MGKLVYDVAIIGGGIIGAAILFYLVEKEKKVVLLEKNNYFARETTQGNSGVIHCGFDAGENKNTAKFNVLGNKLWQESWFKKLEFPRKKADSFVIAFNAEEMQEVEKLYRRGIKNGVSLKHLSVLDREQLLAKEKKLNPEVQGALFCDNSWVIDPVIAAEKMIEKAKSLSADVFNNAEVESVIFEKEKNYFVLKDKQNNFFYAKKVVNAAGHFADEMAAKNHFDNFKQKTRRGEYIVVDGVENLTENVVFMVPTIYGKGVIVAPMLDGNYLVGPTAEDNVLKTETRYITKEKAAEIEEIGKKIFPQIDFKKTKFRYAGSRPIDVESDDFVIRKSQNNPHFIICGGIKSPGISSAPAIAEEVYKLLYF